ncbi:MAG: VTT domain-containing protein [Thermodesulfobacteriota bacterium]
MDHQQATAPLFDRYAADHPDALRPALTDLISETLTKCIACPKCQSECAFLARYGNPADLLASGDPADPEFLKIAYECSLCDLCAAVCPVGLRPGELFLEMRRAAVDMKAAPLKQHAPIMAYEKRGTSRKYTYYNLPENCDTVFFPGCTLSGTRPEQTRRLYEHLKTIVPQIGIVLDCCCKPSHDLGRTAFFEEMFLEMQSCLLGCGVKQVIVACPNCFKVFSNYGDPMAVESVYERLVQHDLPGPPLRDRQQITVHDPCVLRDQPEVQEAVRQLAAKRGIEIVEMPHCCNKTLCCGEGGAVACMDKGLADSWRLRRQTEIQGHHVLTYCAGCANALKSIAPVSHAVDLAIDPQGAFSGQTRVSRAPMTYVNRLRFKRYLKKHEPAHQSRERNFSPSSAAPSAFPAARTGVLLAIVALIAVLHATDATRFLQQDVLRGWVASWGAMAPVIYMAIYTVAPALFLPGLPITIVGGVLFGPVWGVVYSIAGATAGACLAFLISRYMARDWVYARLRSPRWRRLDNDVKRHGWKIVAFTRLIPLFPFNMLNYAFGVTKIRFLDYAVTSFFSMLPACIAYIVFSSSLLDLLRGQISKEFVAGLLLIGIMSLIPVAYRRHQARKGTPHPARFPADETGSEKQQRTG